MNAKETALKTVLYLVTGLFTFVWIWLQIFHSANYQLPEIYYDYFSDTYGIIALIACIFGFKGYKKWGGTKSTLGNSIFFFSLGLLFQFLGQVSYGYYRIVNVVEVAYPSFGEIFYFGSIPLYIYATWKLLDSLGVKKLLKKSFLQVIYLVLISFVMLSLGYFLTLNGYEISDYGGEIKTAIGTALDYAYPISQSILVSLAIFAYFLARKTNGGMLQLPVMLTVIGMYIQYSADTLYTYRVIHETYYGGDYTDMLYIAAYFILGLAFIQYRSVQASIINGRTK